MTTMTNDPQGVALIAVADLRAFAQEMRLKFADGQRMSVRDSDVVHAVDTERWLLGELVPQPKCHTPSYGWSPTAYRAVRKPVNCQKCRRILAAPDELLLPYGEFQPALFTYVPPVQRAADVL
jgi:hypothetical protein